MVDESKGKGKAPFPNTSATSQTDPQPPSTSTSSSSSAARTLASALRSSMASSQLSSVMHSASGGKEGFQPGGGSGELREWLVQDLRSAPPAGGSTSNSAPAARGGFRTQAREENGQELFDEFQRGLSLNGAPRGDEERARGSRWQETGLDPSTARMVGSYTELDGPLHASVRDCHSSTSSTAAPIQRNPPPAATAPLAQTDDIFALLDEEERTTPAAPTTAPQDSDLGSTVLSHFSPHYRPPSPSHPSFSAEQAALHLTLAETQQSSQSRRDLLIPRPDNPALQEGVYAPTAQAALESIFNPTGRTESSDVREESGKEVVRKITRYFGATSYVDDVYGVSPVLREIVETVEREDGEKRERAVRRLEKLWQHLSGEKPKETGAEWVDSWLMKNT